MAMTRAQFMKLMYENLRQVFFERYREKDLVHPRIYDIKDSTLRQEIDESVAGIGMLDIKEENLGMTYDEFIMGFETTYIHTSYAKGLRFSRELVDDERYGVMAKRTQALARSARYRKEYDHAAIFNNADSTTVFTGGDGVALFSTAHPLAGVAGGTFANTPASATQLTPGAIKDALVAFARMVDDRGLLIGLRPSKLLIPPELSETAFEIFKSSGRPYTADNEDNYFKGKLEIEQWDMITVGTFWGILADKADCAPTSFNRKATEFENDNDFDTKELKVSAYQRYSCGYSDPRFIYGSMGR